MVAFAAVAVAEAGLSVGLRGFGASLMVCQML